MRVCIAFVDFPERIVTLVNATLQQMEDSLVLLNTVAELRRAKETAAFFTTLEPEDQALLKDDLLSRSNFPSPGAKVPYVCILDTGVNRGHPLLAPSLESEDVLSIDPDNGGDDRDGHGTGMAGLALWGDLGIALESSGRIEIAHRMESVKLLESDGANEGEPTDLSCLPDGRSRFARRGPCA
jgi:hypothetical protein